MQVSLSVFCVLLVSLLALGGCPSPAPVDPTTEPDLAAVVTVVEAVYSGQGQVIFLGSDDGSVDAELLAQAGAVVQAELSVRVLPESAADRSDPSLLLVPKDPATGELGVSIALNQFRVVGSGRLAVTAWEIRSGLDAQEYDIVLERAGSGWVIVQMDEGAVA
jgi:hypothetical protein